ncbi:MAG: hypothetical protein A2Y88_04780 [Chloroflexi bacterium RBG_13_48_10]|nr:MAG: hypothetical protein A2Y88_04780 [Chloroflexi bacterium RBG_13_48_10]
MQPKRRFLKLWKLVQRENAVQYMMISLFSFVATVSLVRTFLALTGYPQIGGGTLHIAHVLWGGLILYIAAILPLIYLNPRLHIAGAILSGVGVGLFIDEVGKFITRQYDYFFPAAAPIMYVFFLLVVILMIMIRRPETMDGRAELVQALETVREQLYRPLEPRERANIERDLSKVIESDSYVLHQEMARRLLELVRSDMRTVPDRSPAWWLRIAERFERWQTEKRLIWLTGVGMILLGLVTLKNPLQVWLEQNLPNSALVAFLQAHAGRQIAAIDSPLLFNVRLGLEVLVGILLIVATILLGMGKTRQAIYLGYLCLLASLAVLDMLLFYFEQFSTVSLVIFQFVVLSGVILYRSKYLKDKY